ncbi:DUF5361 domain-containing protein [Salininema proteolyticum]|uniref:DUF5361 domain-containing protein n=1 Tax=Salininema proteolyticum TaxID=1607685 RepID=A0ABV8TXW0_9ACTN
MTAGGDGWNLTERLLALAVDELRIANWQRSKHGAKGTNQPKRIAPWAQKPGKKYGDAAGRSPEEVEAILAHMRPHRPSKPEKEG